MSLPSISTTLAVAVEATLTASDVPSLVAVPIAAAAKNCSVIHVKQSVAAAAGRKQILDGTQNQQTNELLL